MPPLRFKRTVLITGSVPLIRLAFGQPPTPFGLPLKGKARAGEDTRPYGTYKRLSGECRRGRRPRRPAGAHCAPLQLKRTPHPSGLRRAPLSLLAFGRPYSGNAPGALAWQTQAQAWDRTSPNFPPSQAPSGAGRNGTQVLLVLRAGRAAQRPRDNPRNRVRGRLPLSGGNVPKGQKG